MKIKQTKFFLGLLVGVVFSHPALATNYLLGDVNTAPNYVVSGANPVSTGPIADRLYFSLSQDSFAGLTLIDLPPVPSIGGLPVSGISGLAGDLYKNVGNSWTYQGSLGASNVVLTNSNFSLGNGSWYLGVSGNATGQGGMYSYAITAVPVPEAGSWAMLLAGLALMGIRLRRRSQAFARLAV